MIFQHIHFSFFKRFCSLIVGLAFCLTTITLPSKAHAQSSLNLPIPGTMIGVSPGFSPTIIRGLSLHPENPLLFDFIVGAGDANLGDEDFRQEAKTLVKYFLASLTVPEDEMWVNLSPYEKDRIIPEDFGGTEMGMDLLAQDYLLKQLTASLVYPEDDLGKIFWNRVYQKAQEKFGTTEIPINTFNKVWIVPDKAEVYEHDGRVFVVKRHLKVMLEEDYLALQNNSQSDSSRKNPHTENNNKELSRVSSDVVRDIVIPEIEKEVNEGKNFATLRQVYNSMILATWYKKNLKESLLGQVYINQNKIKGVDIDNKETKHEIYNQYLEAFKKGVYDYIREDSYGSEPKPIPRKYFSGGAVGVTEQGLFQHPGSIQDQPRYVQEAVLYPEGQGSDRLVRVEMFEHTPKNVLGTVDMEQRLAANDDKYSNDKLTKDLAGDFKKASSSVSIPVNNSKDIRLDRLEAQMLKLITSRNYSNYYRVRRGKFKKGFKNLGKPIEYVAIEPLIPEDMIYLVGYIEGQDLKVFEASRLDSVLEVDKDESIEKFQFGKLPLDTVNAWNNTETSIAQRVNTYLGSFLDMRRAFFTEGYGNQDVTSENVLDKIHEVMLRKVRDKDVDGYVWERDEYNGLTYQALIRYWPEEIHSGPGIFFFLDSKSRLTVYYGYIESTKPLLDGPTLKSFKPISKIWKGSTLTDDVIYRAERITDLFLKGSLASSSLGTQDKLDKWGQSSASSSINEKKIWNLLKTKISKIITKTNYQNLYQIRTGKLSIGMMLKQFGKVAEYIAIESKDSDHSVSLVAFVDEKNMFQVYEARSMTPYIKGGEQIDQFKFDTKVLELHTQNVLTSGDFLRNLLVSYLKKPKNFVSHEIEISQKLTPDYLLAPVEDGINAAVQSINDAAGEVRFKVESGEYEGNPYYAVIPDNSDNAEGLFFFFDLESARFSEKVGRFYEMAADKTFPAVKLFSESKLRWRYQIDIPLISGAVHVYAKEKSASSSLGKQSPIASSSIIGEQAKLDFLEEKMAEFITDKNYESHYRVRRGKFRRGLGKSKRWLGGLSSRLRNFRNPVEYVAIEQKGPEQGKLHLVGYVDGEMLKVFEATDMVSVSFLDKQGSTEEFYLRNLELETFVDNRDTLERLMDIYVGTYLDMRMKFLSDGAESIDVRPKNIITKIQDVMKAKIDKIDEADQENFKLDRNNYENQYYQALIQIVFPNFDNGLGLFFFFDEKKSVLRVETGSMHRHPMQNFSKKPSYLGEAELWKSFISDSDEVPHDYPDVLYRIEREIDIFLKERSASSSLGNKGLRSSIVSSSAQTLPVSSWEGDPDKTKISSSSVENQEKDLYPDIYVGPVINSEFGWNVSLPIYNYFREKRKLEGVDDFATHVDYISDQLRQSSLANIKLHYFIDVLEAASQRDVEERLANEGYIFDVDIFDMLASAIEHFASQPGIGLNGHNSGGIEDTKQAYRLLQIIANEFNIKIEPEYSIDRNFFGPHFIMFFDSESIEPLKVVRGDTKGSSKPLFMVVLSENEQAVMDSKKLFPGVPLVYMKPQPNASKNISSHEFDTLKNQEERRLEISFSDDGKTFKLTNTTPGTGTVLLKQFFAFQALRRAMQSSDSSLLIESGSEKKSPSSSPISQEVILNSIKETMLQLITTENAEQRYHVQSGKMRLAGGWTSGLGKIMDYVAMAPLEQEYVVAFIGANQRVKIVKALWNKKNEKGEEIIDQFEIHDTLLEFPVQNFIQLETMAIVNEVLGRHLSKSFEFVRAKPSSTYQSKTSLNTLLDNLVKDMESKLLSINEDPSKVLFKMERGQYKSQPYITVQQDIMGDIKQEELVFFFDLEEFSITQKKGFFYDMLGSSKEPSFRYFFETQWIQEDSLESPKLIDMVLGAMQLFANEKLPSSSSAVESKLNKWGQTSEASAVEAAKSSSSSIKFLQTIDASQSLQDVIHKGFKFHNAIDFKFPETKFIRIDPDIRLKKIMTLNQMRDGFQEEFMPFFKFMIKELGDNAAEHSDDPIQVEFLKDNNKEEAQLTITNQSKGGIDFDALLKKAIQAAEDGLLFFSEEEIFIDDPEDEERPDLDLNARQLSPEELISLVKFDKNSNNRSPILLFISGLTSKPDGIGKGVGNIRSMAKSFGGKVEIYNRPDPDNTKQYLTTFIVTFPLSSDEVGIKASSSILEGIESFEQVSPVKENAMAIHRASFGKNKTDEGSSPGGIDFNSATLDLQIKRDGKGIPLPVNEQPLEVLDIQGFIPVIINVTPISVPQLLGFNLKEEKNKSAKPGESKEWFASQHLSALRTEDLQLL